MSWATQKKDVSISIKLLNKGGIKAEGVKTKLLATRNSVNVIHNESEYGSIAVNEIKDTNIPFTFFVRSDSIEIERFKLLITDKNKNEWSEFIEIPLKTDQP